MGLLVRVGYAGLAALNLWWGGWARFAPRGFYDTFPGLGHRWVAAYPPYNEHLVTDLGGTFLALGLLLAVAAVVADARVRAVVVAGVLAFNVSHLWFHAGHQGQMPSPDYAASLVTLVTGVVGPIALLLLDVGGRRRQARRNALPSGSAMVSHDERNSWPSQSTEPPS